MPLPRTLIVNAAPAVLTKRLLALWAEKFALRLSALLADLYPLMVHHSPLRLLTAEWLLLGLAVRLRLLSRVASTRGAIFRV